MLTGGLHSPEQEQPLPVAAGVRVYGDTLAQVPLLLPLLARSSPLQHEVGIGYALSCIRMVSKAE